MSAAMSSEMLAEVVVRILEESAFLFVEPVAGGEVPVPALQARIRFSGPQSGWLVLAASERDAAEIASNMLGEQPELTGGEIARQALGELANILTGALVSRVFGAGELTNIGIPELATGEEPVPDGLRAVLRVEGGGAVVVSVGLED